MVTRRYASGGEAVVLVAILALPNVVAMEIVGLRDTFEEACRQSRVTDLYQVRVVAENAEPMRTFSGLVIVPDLGIDDPAGPIDTLAVAGGWGIPIPPSAAVGEWILRQVPSTRRYGAVYTGGFALGALGLLDGRRVTTHWDYAAEFAAAFPKAIVERDHIFVRDGPLFTSAGTASSIDLALSLIEEDCGRDLALTVARRLVLYLKRAGGQPQFSVHLAAQFASSTPIQRAQARVRDNPTGDLSVNQLARQAGMSPRNFARAFVAETTVTPARAVERLRLEAARATVEDTAWPIDKIARDTGFGDTERMRRAFTRAFGQPPQALRRTARGEAAGGTAKSPG